MTRLHRLGISALKQQLRHATCTCSAGALDPCRCPACYRFLPPLRRKTRGSVWVPILFLNWGTDSVGRLAMTWRRFVPLCLSFVLLTVLTVPLLAGTRAESAFKKLQSLAGRWEGKDAHGMAAKTSFEVLASGTALMEKLEPSGM